MPFSNRRFETDPFCLLKPKSLKTRQRGFLFKGFFFIFFQIKDTISKKKNYVVFRAPCPVSLLCIFSLKKKSGQGMHADRLMLFVACFLLPLMPLRGKEDKGHKQALSSILTSTFKPSFSCFTSFFYKVKKLTKLRVIPFKK